MPWGSLSGMAFNYNAPAELFSTAPGVRRRKSWSAMIALQALPRPFATLLNSFTRQAELFWKSTRSVTLMLS